MAVTLREKPKPAEPDSLIPATPFLPGIDFEEVTLGIRETYHLEPPTNNSAFRVTFDGSELWLTESAVQPGSSGTRSYQLAINGEIIAGTSGVSRIPNGQFEGDYSFWGSTRVVVGPDTDIQVLSMKVAGFKPILRIRLEPSTSSLLCYLSTLAEESRASSMVFKDCLSESTPIAEDPEIGSRLQRILAMLDSSEADEIDGLASNKENFSAHFELAARTCVQFKSLGRALSKFSASASDLDVINERLESRLQNLKDARTDLYYWNLGSRTAQPMQWQLLVEYDGLLREARHLAEAINYLPKRYCPEKLSDIRSGDVVVDQNGKRFLVEVNVSHTYDHSLTLSPKGHPLVLKDVLLELIRSGHVSHFERGRGVSLFPGLESAVYTPVGDWGYLKPGDTIHTGHERKVILSTPSAKNPTVQLVHYVDHDATDKMSVMLTTHTSLPRLKVTGPDQVTVTQRVSMEGRTPEEIFDHVCKFLDINRRNSKQQSPPSTNRGNAHPIVANFDHLMQGLSRLTADYVQSYSDLVLSIPVAARQTHLRNLNSVLRGLRDLNDFRLTLREVVLPLTDFVQIAPEATVKPWPAVEIAPILKPESRGNFSQVANDILEQMRTQFDLLHEQIAARSQLTPAEQDVARDEIADAKDTVTELESRLVKLIKQISRDRKRTKESQTLVPSDLFTRRILPSERTGTLVDQLRDIAATVPWAATAEEASANGAHFHYDPTVVERMIMIQGAELIGCFKPSMAPGGERLVGALLYYPPDHIPEEFQEAVEATPFTTSMYQLLLVAPDLKDQGVPDLLNGAYAVQLQATEARGYFGTIPGGHLASFASQLRGGAVLNHGLQPIVTRPGDGSIVPKRGFERVLDPRASLHLTPEGRLSPREKDSRLRLLAQEHEETKRDSND